MTPARHCGQNPGLSGPARPRWLLERPYAHRGLHGRGVPENSLAAFRAAIADGYGIECDVRLSRDGVAHVFHDRGLARLTGAEGRIDDLDAAVLARLRLTGGDEPPPTLAALLALCAETPLLVEVKADRDAFASARLCEAVANDLAGHEGPVAVISFDPRVLHWFAAHAPHIPRGQTLPRRHRCRAKALAIARARPHFLTCDVRDLPGTIPPRLPLICWTVRTTRQRVLAARHGAQIIFEA
ncbi:MAG: glycerophosphodiester phosphodiesterase [Sphingobium sp.]|nr:glycerophosphodiester phosphodiesterase [Sphingobium sp.]